MAFRERLGLTVSSVYIRFAKNTCNVIFVLFFCFGRRILDKRWLRFPRCLPRALFVDFKWKSFIKNVLISKQDLRSCYLSEEDEAAG